MRDRSDHELEQLFALDANAGPARPVDDRRATAIIAGALGTAGFPSPASGGGAAVAKTAIKVKLAIITGGIATIAVAWFALHTGRRAPATTAQPAVAQPAVEPSPVPVTATPTPTPVAVDPSPLPRAAQPSLAPAAAPARGSFDPSLSTSAADVSSVAPSRTPAKPHERGHARAAAADPLDDLLAEANAQRAAHDWKAADALYARVVARSPKGLAGQTALVASAQLHLEHLGDPAGAEKRFRSALAHAGSLAEDARWGVVECEHARGDTAAERRALDDFLAHHPSSPITPRARARLAELPP